MFIKGFFPRVGKNQDCVVKSFKGPICDVVGFIHTGFQGFKIRQSFLFVLMDQGVTLTVVLPERHSKTWEAENQHIPIPF